MKFDDIVLSPNELQALFLEEFSFAIPNVIEGLGMPSDDDFGDPPSTTPVPKAVSPPQHRSKFG